MIIFFIGVNHFAANILHMLCKNKVKIAYVITKHDKRYGRGLKIQPSPVKYIAQRCNLNIYETESVNDKNSKLFLRINAPDVIIIVEYGEKIEDDVIAIPKYGIINAHPSVLPSLRGSTPIEHAIINGYGVTGVSIIKINDKIDAGDILKILTCKINEKDTYDSLIKKLARLASKSLIYVIKNIRFIDVQLIKQDDTQVTYTSKLQKNFYRINWSDNALTINRKIRSTFSKKKHLTQINNCFINIIETRIIIRYKKQTVAPGTIIKVSKMGVDVITNENVLRIKKIQFPNKKIINIKDNLKDNFFYVGNNFV